MKLRQLYEAKLESGILKTITSYIERKLDMTLIRIPGIEEFTNSEDHGFGVRFIIAGTKKCIRFNWASKASVNSTTSLKAIDVFTGATRDPNFTITAAPFSLVKTLPQVVNILKKPKIGSFVTFPVNQEEALSEAIITEVRRSDFTAEEALNDFFKKLENGDSLTRTDFIVNYHISNVGIFDAIMKGFKDKFIINGKRISLASNTGIPKLKAAILDKAGIIDVAEGGRDEQYAASQEEKEAEEELKNKVPYVETIEHLKSLVKALIKGSFNSLFVGGPGGCLSSDTKINIKLNDNN